jgi:ribose transport system permease protein
VGARFSGLPVGRNLMSIYAFSGLMAALAAIIFVSWVIHHPPSDMGSGSNSTPSPLLFSEAPASRRQGQHSGYRHRPRPDSTSQNGLALMGVTSDATIIVIGTTLILAILVNNLIQGRRGGAM